MDSRSMACLILALLLMQLVWCSGALEQKNLQDILKGYDPHIRPGGINGTGPVIVEVNTYVRSITDINDVSMEYSVQLTFRQSWTDPRLRFEAVSGQPYVFLTQPERLWVPDLFFSNEMSGHFHHMLTPNNLLRIYPDGKVLYSTRISMKLLCPMDLRNYPMDNQLCGIIGASYGYTVEDVEFKWKPEEPVQMSSRIFLPRFSLGGFKHGYCTSKTSTGEYSCVKLDFALRRKFTFYLVQAYFPSLSLVLLSVATFWLRPLSLRLGVWVGLLLSMLLLASHVGASGPRVSYLKAIDVWMGTCVSFLFCVLLQICAVSSALAREQRHQEDTADNSLGVDDKGGRGDKGRASGFSSTPLRWLNRYSTRADRIDAFSRVLFPACFAFFNFVYWITYAT